MRMMLGGYCLALLRDADYDAREAEGVYCKTMGDRNYYRLPARDLEAAKTVLLASLPEAARPLVTWEGAL